MTFLPGLDLPAILPQPTAEDDDWYTPRWLLGWLPPVGLDPCAAARAHVAAERRFDLRAGQDGLALPWEMAGGEADRSLIVFCNPPYSDCARWVERCRSQAEAQVRPVVALIPAKPGEVYWFDHVWGQAKAVGFLRGRVRFDTVNGPAKDAATFGSALVVWGPPALAALAVGGLRCRAEGDTRRPVWLDASPARVA